MTTILDYTGRTYDVSAFQGVQPIGDVPLEQSLWDAGSGGAICTGIQKLAQWFVIEVLLERASMPYDPDRGNDFLHGFTSGAYRTETDIMVGFGLAAGAVQARALLVETADTPADERFAAASLTSVQIQEGGAVLHVRLTSRAGAARAIILPIPVIH